MNGDGFVSAGGDLAARGAIIGRAAGRRNGCLVRGALATSGTDRRRWVRAGRPQHHLIDPRTGSPSLSPWQQVTVCGVDVRRRGYRRESRVPARPRRAGVARRPRPPGAVRTADGGALVNRSWQRSLERPRPVHLTSNPVDWYAARAAGLTAYLLLSRSRLLGLTMAAQEGLRPLATVQRRRHPPVRRPARRDLRGDPCGHGRDRLLASVLARSLVVPFTTRYRPLWVGLGIAAAELLLALAVTNHYRRRLRLPFWRRAHYLNFAVWTARHPSRPRKRHRPQLALAARQLRGRRLRRLSSRRLAARRESAPARATRLTRRPSRAARGGSRRRPRTRPAAVQAEPVERRPLHRNAHRSHRPAERHQPRHRLDGRRRSRTPARSRSRRSPRSPRGSS